MAEESNKKPTTPRPVESGKNVQNSVEPSLPSKPLPTKTKVHKKR